MGDQTPSITSREEIIAVDPDYMSDVTKDNDGKDAEKGTNTEKIDIGKVLSAEKTDTEGKTTDGTPDDKKKEKEKEDVGMGNYGVRITPPSLVVVVSKPNPTPQRILKYGTKLDWTLQFVGAIAAIAAGVALYVVPAVIWRLVGRVFFLILCFHYYIAP